MYEQINAQFSGMGKQYAAAAMKANGLMIENAERIFGLQMRTLEANVAATADFLVATTEARNIEDLKTLLPQGAQVAKENIERMVQTGQEAFGETIRTQQAMGEIARTQFEDAGERTRAATSKAAKAAK